MTARQDVLTRDQNEALRAALRRIIEERGLVQKQVADILGASQQTVSNFLNGRIGVGTTLGTKIVALAGREPRDFGLSAATLNVLRDDGETTGANTVEGARHGRILSRIKDALGAAFDPQVHSVDDIAAVRSMVLKANALPMWSEDEDDFRALARVWLDAAAQLRSEGAFNPSAASFAFELGKATAIAHSRAVAYFEMLNSLRQYIEEFDDAPSSAEPDDVQRAKHLLDAIRKILRMSPPSWPDHQVSPAAQVPNPSRATPAAPTRFPLSVTEPEPQARSTDLKTSSPIARELTDEDTEPLPRRTPVNKKKADSRTVSERPKGK